MKTKKKILDVCCGSRMFYFDQQNPNVLFNDIRDGEFEDRDGRITFVHPDTTYDFKDLPFDDRTFHHVVFDPPHLIAEGRTKGIDMMNRYGSLQPNWIEDLQKGLLECYRVLKNNGTLIFKWSEHDITVNEIMRLVVNPTGLKPLYGHRTTTKQTTIWMAFVKTERRKL